MMPFRLFAKRAEESTRIVIVRGGKGRYRWRLVNDQTTLALASVGSGFLSPEGAERNWRRTARAVGADPYIPIELVEE